MESSKENPAWAASRVWLGVWNYAKSLYIVCFQIATINPYADPRRCCNVRSVFTQRSLEIFGNSIVFFTVCQNFRFIRKPDVSISLPPHPPPSSHSTQAIQKELNVSVSCIFILKTDVEWNPERLLPQFLLPLPPVLIDFNNIFLSSNCLWPWHIVLWMLLSGSLYRKVSQNRLWCE